jgi:hypothetical protein
MDMKMVDGAFRRIRNLNFTFQLCSSHFGGVEIMLITVLFSDTLCKPGVVFDRLNGHNSQARDLPVVEVGMSQAF